MKDGLSKEVVSDERVLSMGQIYIHLENRVTFSQGWSLERDTAVCMYIHIIDMSDWI